MARVTRSAAKSNKEDTSTTGSSTVSPFFSAQSSAAGDTPISSDVEEASPAKVSRGGKRAKPVSEDEMEVDDELQTNRTSKRRAVQNRAYVEIQTNPAASSSIGRRGRKGSAKDTPQTPKSVKATKTPTTKAKGKAPVRPSAKDHSDDEESNSELEYDENLTESGSSGSEFQDSDSSAEVVSDEDESDNTPEVALVSRSTRRSPQKAKQVDSDFEMDPSDAEEVALSAAIHNSLAPASSSNGNNRGNEAARRAAAAVARIARANESEDSDNVLPTDSENSEVPLAKAKGKGSTKKGGKSMTPAEMRKEKRVRREEAKLKNNPAKKDEMALRKKLGRKLTFAEKMTVALEHHHPELKSVWGDLEKRPLIELSKAEQPKSIKLTLLPFQLESLHWMQKQEAGDWHGGMLADEMGMGKTIQMISLLLSDTAKPNLVVAPTVAIMQWRNEIEAHTDNLKVLVWYGQSRESSIKELQKYDVVLTTYAVLESSFRKQHKPFKRNGQLITINSPVHQLKWNRIILDEAHNIKERSTNTAKAAFELKAKYRWCLSGTPLQNRVGELYSLIRFLGGDPFAFYFCRKCDCRSLHWKFSDKKGCDDCGHTPMFHTCLWNHEILRPIQKHGLQDEGHAAFQKLRILLDRMMLRRTKLERADDLGLPPRTVIVRRDYFSPEEKELYLSLFSDAKRQFATYLDQGTVLNNYSNIFSLLTRMRQMACHPDLVLRSKANAAKFVPEAEEATVCRICNDIAEDAIQSRCRHIFDRECIKQYLNTAVEQNPACPVCHLPLTIDLEAQALELEQNVTARQGILGRLDLSTWRSSTKIEALVEELSTLRRQDSTTKSIVFSQFVNFLDLIAFRLQRAGFTVCRLEGTMSPQARDATIQHFMKNVEVTVFLVSLKAGGVALNLTEASRVYLMDSWWNPAVEFQAMDRIHRLGQHRPVKAIKLVVEDSIESRIVQLQEKKAAMVDATLSNDDSAMGRLTPEDLGFLFKL